MTSDPDRVLRPVDEADRAIDRLATYRSPDELADAVRTVGRAVDRTLRLLLRGEPSVPGSLRVRALAADELSADRLRDALRQHGLISLELAGRAHELERAAERAARGDARAADADVARHAVELLRSEVERRRERPAGAAPPAVPTPDEGGGLAVAPVPPARGGRRGWLIAAFTAAALAILAVFLYRAWTTEADRAIEAFDAGRFDEAESGFASVVEDDPDNITARLYLARIYRRQERSEEAAEMLRDAVRRAPEDPDVRRELGYLFLDLGRPRAAVGQFERAVEIEPEDSMNWIALVRALRAAGDPRAEEVLRRAPPDARALLDRTSGIEDHGRSE